VRPEEPLPWQRSCPVMHGPRTHEFWRGWGWLFLAVSLLIHALILWSLPIPLRSVLSPHEDILIALKDPPPPPPPPPEPPEPEPEDQPEPQPQSIEPPPPQVEPPPSPAEPGPVIGVEGDGPGAIQSGDSLPAFPEPPAPPEPEPEPPPPPPEPEPEPVVDVQALLLSYAGEVKAAILAEKYYPPVAERLGHTGSVKVGFTVAADGSLAGVRVKSGSGWDELDAAALEAVRRAAPFDQLPPESGRDELGLSITLKYSLN